MTKDVTQYKSRIQISDDMDFLISKPSTTTKNSTTQILKFLYKIYIHWMAHYYDSVWVCIILTFVNFRLNDTYLYCSTIFICHNYHFNRTYNLVFWLFFSFKDSTPAWSWNQCSGIAACFWVWWVRISEAPKP